MSSCRRAAVHGVRQPRRIASVAISNGVSGCERYLAERQLLRDEVVVERLGKPKRGIRAHGPYPAYDFLPALFGGVFLIRRQPSACESVWGCWVARAVSGSIGIISP